MERFTVGRMYIYDSTITRLPSSGQIGVNDLATLTKVCGDHGGGNITLGAAPLLDRKECFDFALGSQYIMGSIPGFHSNLLYDPADPDADALAMNLKEWTTLYKTYSSPRPSGAAGLFLSNMIHLRRPDSR